MRIKKIKKRERTELLIKWTLKAGERRLEGVKAPLYKCTIINLFVITILDTFLYNQYWGIFPYFLFVRGNFLCHSFFAACFFWSENTARLFDSWISLKLETKFTLFFFQYRGSTILKRLRYQNNKYIKASVKYTINDRRIVYRDFISSQKFYRMHLSALKGIISIEHRGVLLIRFTRLGYLNVTILHFPYWDNKTPKRRALDP